MKLQSIIKPADCRAQPEGAIVRGLPADERAFIWPPQKDIIFLISAVSHPFTGPSPARKSNHPSHNKNLG
jgi:hypothetical protein